MAGDDFVMVQLTAAGEKMAQGHPLHIGSDRRSFTFLPSTPLRVERSYEWQALLSKHVTPAGDAVVELLPVAAAGTPSANHSTNASTEADTAHEETH